MTTRVPRSMLEANTRPNVGEGRAFFGSNVPAGWLLCNGQAVSRTTYALLFTEIGTTYGTGDGSTTFNVPDLRGRALVGRDTMGTTAADRIQVQTTITTTNGSASATVGSATGLCVGMSVISGTVPAGITITAISGTTITLSTGTGVVAGTTQAARFSLFPDPTVRGSTGGTATHVLTVAQMPAHNHPVNDASAINAGSASKPASSNNTGATPTTSNTGGDQAHPNIQPSMVADWIIYAGV